MTEEKIRIVKCEGFMTGPIKEIIYHDVPINQRRCGIYKLVFGEKYYIGQSIHISKRAKAHQYEIARIFNSNQPSGKRANLIDHLRNNKGITSIHVFVLERCAEIDLQKTEQKWLSKSKNDKNCLNSNFTALITPNVAMANKFKPVEVSINIVLNTQRELNLYNTFRSNLNAVKLNPRVNLDK